MSWDLRSKYAFDASEGQIPEGFASVYGPANSHANCVPASFTAALVLAGFPDLDPQEVTNSIYGPNYRGGFGSFARIIAWLRDPANFPGAPSFSDGPFDFAAADTAGANGQIIIVAGWINAASVTFTAQANANGFSHASLLVAHDTTTDKWVIWNTWTGQLQTYDRAVLAASLYEMSVMAPGAYSGGSGNLGGNLDPATLAQILYMLFLGRLYTGAEGDWLVALIKSNPADFTGKVIGSLSGSAEGKHWQAGLDELRAAATLAGTQGPKGDKGDPGLDGKPGKDGMTPTSGTITGGTVKFP